jgi:hypothetical protein
MRPFRTLVIGLFLFALPAWTGEWVRAQQPATKPGKPNDQAAGAKEALVVRGEIYHRVRIPQDDKDFNVVLAGGDWKEGIIPVRGRVRVEAWTPRGDASIDKNQPADIVAASDDKGRFEVSIPDPEQVKLIRLRFTYSNKQARLLTECTTFEMDAGYIAKALGATDKPAQLDSLKRVTECWLRWEEKPKRYSLGDESAGGPVARRSGGTTTLEFTKTGGIFVNTFILQAPYVNQNTHPIKLANVNVPAKMILDLLAKNTPAADLPATEAAVRTRLSLAAGQAVPDESTTELTIGGGEVCFPSSAAMALGCLGVVDDAAKGLQQIGQGCYDYFYKTNKEKNPSAFPYRAPRFGSRTWPFSDNGDKQWLTTRPEGGYHPWQVASPAEPNLPGFVKQQFHVSTALRESVNVFADKADRRDRDVLQNLGRGNPALVSISHRRYADAGQGGHLLCLLGAVVDNQGRIVRLIVHDPFGDQSQHPATEGYYDGKAHSGPAPASQDKSLFDKDADGDKGAYAPYGSDINSFRGTLESKYMLWFLNPKARQSGDPPDTPATSVDTIRNRLLPSETPSIKQ